MKMSMSKYTDLGSDRLSFYPLCFLGYTNFDLVVKHIKSLLYLGIQCSKSIFSPSICYGIKSKVSQTNQTKKGRQRLALPSLAVVGDVLESLHFPDEWLTVFDFADEYHIGDADK